MKLKEFKPTHRGTPLRHTWARHPQIRSRGDPRHRLQAARPVTFHQSDPSPDGGIQWVHRECSEGLPFRAFPKQGPVSWKEQGPGDPLGPWSILVRGHFWKQRLISRP